MEKVHKSFIMHYALIYRSGSLLAVFLLIICFLANLAAKCGGAACDHAYCVFYIYIFDTTSHDFAGGLGRLPLWCVGLPLCQPATATVLHILLAFNRSALWASLLSPLSSLSRSLSSPMHRQSCGIVYTSRLRAFALTNAPPSRAHTSHFYISFCAYKGSA